MNKWINLPLTMVLAFCGIWASPAAFARIVVVGVETTQQMPYYGMCGEDYCGYGKELLDRFASDMDFTIKYRPMPILRLHRELIDGRIDLKFPASADWQPHLKKNKAIRYSAPLADYIDGVMMLSPPSADIHRLGTIHGFTLDVFGHIAMLGRVFWKVWFSHALAPFYDAPDIGIHALGFQLSIRAQRV